VQNHHISKTQHYSPNHSNLENFKLSNNLNNLINMIVIILNNSLKLLKENIMFIMIITIIQVIYHKNQQLIMKIHNTEIINIQKNNQKLL